jgi:surface polysaccharide O-acyltransferase-like enzyme
MNRMKKTITKRESNFELLRIIAMIGIILFHYSDHGCNDISFENALSINVAFEYVTRIGGGVGNCIFMLLTGYFMSQSKFRINKLLKIWGEVFFYSFFSYIVAVWIKVTYFTKTDFLTSLLPITSNQYWYFTSYVIILIMSPLINLALERVDKKMTVAFILALFYFFSVMPTLGFGHTTSNDRIGVMALLYCIGAFIRKYCSDKKRTKLYCECGIAVGLFIFYSLFSIFYDKFEHLPAFLSDRFCLVWGIEKISIIVFSVFCFLIFKNINLGFNAIINWIASSTFGIYLLHMNNWTTFYIWDVLCKTKKYYMSKFMILHVIICCIVIFLVCMCIDKIRIYVFEKPAEKAILEIDKIRSKVFLGVSVLLLLLLIVFTYNQRLYLTYGGNLSYSQNSEIISLDKNHFLNEKFYNNKKGNLKKIVFHTITWNNVYEETQELSVCLLDEKKNIVWSKNIPLKLLSDQGDYEIWCDEDITLNEKRWYELSFTTNLLDEQKDIAVMATEKIKGRGTLYIDGDESQQQLSAQVWLQH